MLEEECDGDTDTDTENGDFCIMLMMFQMIWNRLLLKFCNFVQ